MSAAKVLVLGGSKSGKSAHAEQLALNIAAEQNRRVVYFATANATDNDVEMQRRIERHQQTRQQDTQKQRWQTIETGKYLAAQLADAQFQNNIVLIDCLTLWITAWLMSEPQKLDAEISQFLKALTERNAPTILVSNENSLGITPLGELSRNYLDIVGQLHQDTAKICNSVILTVAGLPFSLKPPPASMDI